MKDILKSQKRKVLLAASALLLIVALPFCLGRSKKPVSVTPEILSFFHPIEVSAAEVTPYIRVGLFYGSTAKESGKLTISCSQGLSIGTGSKSGFTKTEELPVTKVVAYVENGKIVLRDENGTTVVEDFTADLCLWPTSGGKIAVNMSSVYRDGIMLRVWNGKITVINLVGLEHYLYGVINSEMNYSNEMEALKAQAVVARSYAVCASNKHAAYGFDVCATTDCQVYKGYYNEKSRTTAAVNETKGQLLRYAGEPVRGYYSSNSGGYTMNCEDVWGNYSGYLRAVEDIYSPAYRWSCTFTYEELAKLVSSDEKPAGEILSVEVTKWTDYGSVYELTITGTENTFVFTGEKVRTGFASSYIKSQRFTVSCNADETILYAAGDADPQRVADTVYVLQDDETVVAVPTASLTLQSSAFVTGVPSQADTSGVKTVTFTGTGNGHSIGMSQDGAKAMAALGFGYADILKFYYTDVEVY